MSMGFKIPKKYRVNYSIPVEKIYSEPVWQDGQEPQIRWDYKLSPKTATVKQDQGDKTSFEEIHFFTLRIHDNEDAGDLYRYVLPMFRAVKYAVVLTLQYRNKQKVVCCTYRQGTRNSDKNILVGLRMTAWIYPTAPSTRSEEFYAKVNGLLKEDRQISDLYKEICIAVDLFRAEYMNKSRTIRLMKDLIGRNLTVAFTGKPTDPFRFCTTFHYYPPISRSGKYVTKRSSIYHTEFDYEDLWYCFQQDERFREAIEKRRYKDMEDLVYRIESAYEDF